MSNDAMWMNADSGAPSFEASELRRAMAALLLQGQADRFGARAGVRPGDDAVSLSGTTVTVHDHAGVSYPGLSTTAGPYLYQHVETTHELDPADGSNDRIDAIDIQTQDDDEDASGFRRVRSVYVVGTPAATPSEPALTANAFRAATVLVPSGGSPAPTLTYVAPAAVTNGGVLPLRDASERPLVAGRYPGLVTFREDDGLVEVWDGSAWVLVGPAPDPDLPVMGAGGTSGTLALTTSFQTLRDATVTIPSHWASWTAHLASTFQVSPNSATANRNCESQLLHGGDVVSFVVNGIVFAGNPMVRTHTHASATRTGTGSQTFSVQARLTLSDTYDALNRGLSVVVYRVS